MIIIGLILFIGVVIFVIIHTVQPKTRLHQFKYKYMYPKNYRL